MVVFETAFSRGVGAGPADLIEHCHNSVALRYSETLIWPRTHL